MADKKNKDDPIQENPLDTLQRYDKEQQKELSKKDVKGELSGEDEKTTKWQGAKPKKKEDEILTPEQQVEKGKQSILDLTNSSNLKMKAEHAGKLIESSRALDSFTDPKEFKEEFKKEFETGQLTDKDVLKDNKEALADAVKPLNELAQDKNIDKKTRKSIKQVTEPINNFLKEEAEQGHTRIRDNKQTSPERKTVGSGKTNKEKNSLIKKAMKIMSQAEKALESRMQNSTEKSPTRNQENKKQRVENKKQRVGR